MCMPVPKDAILSLNITDMDPLMTLVTQAFDHILVDPAGLERLYKLHSRHRRYSVVKLFVIPKPRMSDLRTKIKREDEDNRKSNIPECAVFELEPFSRLTGVAQTLLGLTEKPDPLWGVLVTMEAKLLSARAGFWVHPCSFNVPRTHVREVRVPWGDCVRHVVII